MFLTAETKWLFSAYSINNFVILKLIQFSLEYFMEYNSNNVTVSGIYEIIT